MFAQNADVARPFSQIPTGSRETPLVRPKRHSSHTICMEKVLTTRRVPVDLLGTY